MANEPVLPRLTWDPVVESCSNNGTRKRVRLSSPPVSSDPAIFSSDDDPSADNYTQERRKRNFKGPWYRQIPSSDLVARDGWKRGKRTLERQYDSGVFMGSDGTDIDEGIDELVGEATLKKALPLRHSRTVKRIMEPSPEELAQGVIQRCLDNGDESIDLSSGRLETLSNSTIRPLATFTRIPPVTEGVFYRLEPKLKIFLASNSLRALPEELFNLERLTVLSLRSNQLRELPPGIGKLLNLRELNVSHNSLPYLPFEILDLFTETGRIENLQIHPNPFHHPHVSQEKIPEADADVSPRYKIGVGTRSRPQAQGGLIRSAITNMQRSWHPRWNCSFQERTEVRYFDISGSLTRGPRFPGESGDVDQMYHHQVPTADAGITSNPPAPGGNFISHAPSLLEISLSACIRTPHYAHLASLLPLDVPLHIPALLSYAVAKKESGVSKCTVCGRRYIVPRTEWIEWWEIAKVVEKKGMASAASPLRTMENERDVFEAMVPLIRRGCSWFCVPQRVEYESVSAAFSAARS